MVSADDRGVPDLYALLHVREMEFRRSCSLLQVCDHLLAHDRRDGGVASILALGLRFERELYVGHLVRELLPVDALAILMAAAWFWAVAGGVSENSLGSRSQSHHVQVQLREVQCRPLQSPHQLVPFLALKG